MNAPRQACAFVQITFSFSFSRPLDQSIPPFTRATVDHCIRLRGVRATFRAGHSAGIGGGDGRSISHSAPPTLVNSAFSSTALCCDRENSHSTHCTPI